MLKATNSDNLSTITDDGVDELYKHDQRQRRSKLDRNRACGAIVMPPLVKACVPPVGQAMTHNSDRYGQCAHGE
jgi:hypothetical protein